MARSACPRALFSSGYSVWGPTTSTSTTSLASVAATKARRSSMVSERSRSTLTRRPGHAGGSGGGTYAFATMATGGFSTRTASVAAYNSVYLEIVIIVFMFLAGTNFALNYRALRGKPLCFAGSGPTSQFLFW